MQQPDPRARPTLLRTGALVRHNVLLLLREPGPLLSRLLLPLGFLVLLRPLYTAAQGRADGTAQAAVGTLVTFSLLALSIVGSSILTERLARTWSRLRATAARPGEILAGKALPAMAVLMLQQLAILGCAAALGLRIDHPALLACPSCCAGRRRCSDSAGCSGCWRGAWANCRRPTTWAAAGLRDALAGDTAGVLRASGVLLGVAVVGAGLAVARLCGRGGSARAVAL